MAEASSGEKDIEPWNRFVSDMTKTRMYPINEFEHAAWLADSEKSECPKDFTKEEFAMIVDHYIQTANFSDDYLLQLEQMTAQNLINFFDMARREPGLRSFFLIRFHEWRSSILLTKTKDGSEREKQGAVGTKYTPMRSGGFGGDGYVQVPGQDSQDKPKDANFLKKILGRK